MLRFGSPRTQKKNKKKKKKKKKKGVKLSGKVFLVFSSEYMTLIGKDCASYLSASSLFLLSPSSFFMDATR
jgi:ATP/ADP translocase